MNLIHEVEEGLATYSRFMGSTDTLPPPTAFDARKSLVQTSKILPKA